MEIKSTPLYEATALVKPRDKRDYVSHIYVHQDRAYMTDAQALAVLDLPTEDGWYRLESRRKTGCVLEYVGGPSTHTAPSYERTLQGARDLEQVDLSPTDPGNLAVMVATLTYDIIQHTDRPWDVKYVQMAGRSFDPRTCEIRAHRTDVVPCHFELEGYELCVMGIRLPT